MFNDLDYEGSKFPVSKRDYCKIEKKNDICINLFCSENDLTYPVYVSDQEFGDCLDLLMISYDVYINNFKKFMCNKRKNKNKKYFCKYYLQCFSSKKSLAKTQIKLFSNEW